MTHFGIICPPYPGHLNPQSALGRELQKRGHQVTVLQLSDLEEKVHSEGLNFAPVGLSLYEPGLLKKTFEELAKFSGIEALNYSVKFCQLFTEILCQDAPTAISKLGIDALIVDQLEPVGETIAEALSLPLICISCGQAIHRRDDVPPFFTPWLYQTVGWARLRNKVAYWILDRSCQPILKTINSYRQQWQLSSYPNLYAANPTKLAQISQQAPAFDFPIPNLPDNFYYAGPFRNASPCQVSFPYQRLTGQPLIYASLGSVQNTKGNVFRCIAEACQDLDIQLVITHGGGMSEAEARTLPGSPLVVEYAPQVEVLSRASLTVTHGGMNTVLDSLSFGVPLVAIPITFEQPGTGARIRWTKTGEVIPVSRLSVTRLKQAIRQVLTDSSYAENAQIVQRSIQKAGGVKRAVDIIEKCVKIEKLTVTR